MMVAPLLPTESPVVFDEVPVLHAQAKSNDESSEACPLSLLVMGTSSTTNFTLNMPLHQSSRALNGQKYSSFSVTTPGVSPTTLDLVRAGALVWAGVRLLVRAAEHLPSVCFELRGLAKWRCRAGAPN